MVILPTEEFDAAIVIYTGKVAGMIRIDAFEIDEFLFIEVIAVDIASSYPIASD